MNKNRVIGILFVVAAIGIAVATYIKYYPRLADYKKGRDLYNDIRKEYTSMDDDLPNVENSGNKRKTENVEKPEKTESVNENETIEDGTESITESITENSSNDADAFLNLSPLVLGLSKKANLSDYRCISIDAVGLKKKNKDFVGWIYIPKTNISYPVVLSKDNSDYLHKNFAGEYNYPGTIFMDCRCEKGVLNHHTVLYGHNMRDGSMFANIKSYMDEKFFKEHPVFWFITPKYKLLYRVFSTYETGPYDKIAYSFDNSEYNSNEEFIDVINEMQEKSVVKTDKDIKLEDTDYVMSLSTCTSARTTRIVVHGVLLGSYNGPTESVEEVETESESELH